MCCNFLLAMAKMLGMRLATGSFGYEIPNTALYMLLSAPLVSVLTFCSWSLKLFPFLSECKSLAGFNKKRWGFRTRTTVPS